MPRLHLANDVKRLLRHLTHPGLGRIANHGHTIPFKASPAARNTHLAKSWKRRASSAWPLPACKSLMACEKTLLLGNSMASPYHGPSVCFLKPDFEPHSIPWYNRGISDSAVAARRTRRNVEGVDHRAIHSRSLLLEQSQWVGDCSVAGRR